MSEEGSNICKNCGTRSEHFYCPSCGQRLSVHKVTFSETFGDLAEAFFSVNAPLLYTVKELVISPGVLLRNYLNGQRRRYYKPVSFFLLTTFLYLIIRSIIGFDPFRNSMIVVEEGSLEGTSLTDARNYMLLNINNFLFIFVFTLAIFTKLLFHKRYSLAEFIAISFYVLGMYTLLVTCNMFLVQYLGDFMQPAGILIMFIYFIYAMCSLFQKSYFVVILKSAILFMLAFVSYFMLSYGLSYLIVSYKQG
ncbi:DUF3667 domain-containing protein [Muriicola sp.]|uniref:DUF3667 domain-containing protein n=1 Tax=Muriicola sp. TaxID=2020856 RepID=UPI003C79371F